MLEQGSTATVLSQRSDQASSDIAAHGSFLLRMRTQLTKAFIEHIYSTEDTLFKITYDQKFRPKLYALCMKEPVDKDAARLYKALKQSYDDDEQDHSSSTQSQLENRNLNPPIGWEMAKILSKTLRSNKTMGNANTQKKNTYHHRKKQFTLGLSSEKR